MMRFRTAENDLEFLNTAHVRKKMHWGVFFIKVTWTVLVWFCWDVAGVIQMHLHVCFYFRASFQGDCIITILFKENK